MYVYDNILRNSSRKTNSFRKKVQRKSKHTFHVICFFPENRATYTIITKKMTDRQAIDNRTQYGTEKNIPFAYGVIKTKIYSVIIFNTCCVSNAVCKSEHFI
jgi:hypothetical protein